MTILAALTAFLATVWLTRRFCDPASRFHILDHPTERSLHHQPVPRTGGVAVVSGVLAGWLVLTLAPLGGTPLHGIVLSALPVALVSFLDDRHGVHPGVRFLVHLGVAGLLLGAGLLPATIGLPGLVWTPPPTLAAGLAILFVVWMINLYNFMDGMDGFAGGMTVIGFATFAFCGLQAGHAPFASASLLVAAASAGFLVFNFPPARIFLGDCGSSTLGFLAAAFSLWGSLEHIFPWWTAVLIFSPFTVDATVTLCRRLLRGEKIWLPHKTHYYQRLVQLGWGHRRTLLAEYRLMLACSLSAILAGAWPPPLQIGLALLWLAAYILLMVGVERLDRRHDRVTAP
jgi:UDP-N-acetylmuramyl pentapeptide phosphotransferase/UDP-N-acetylglucosamine-1-phosphate transferase